MALRLFLFVLFAMAITYESSLIENHKLNGEGNSRNANGEENINMYDEIFGNNYDLKTGSGKKAGIIQQRGNLNSVSIKTKRCVPFFWCVKPAKS